MKLSPSDSAKLHKQVHSKPAQYLNIDIFIREAKKNLKRVLLESSLEANGIKIRLTTTKTRFGGEKFWFVCPGCGRRAAVLIARCEAVLQCGVCK